MSFKIPNIAMKYSRSSFVKDTIQPLLKQIKARAEISLASAEIISMQNKKILNTSAQIISKADLAF